MSGQIRRRWFSVCGGERSAQAGTAALIVVLAVGLPWPGVALEGRRGVIHYAPPDAAGPPLSVSESELKGSLTCSGDLADGGREPVLLVPGTTVTPDEHFGWNYMPALDSLGWPWCAVATPKHATEDMQISAEYVVYAIRTMYQRAGRRIGMLGGSQGGSLPRWALRFWPDTRAMVEDHIGLGATNHGGRGIYYYCLPASASSVTKDAGCAPALWQQLHESNLARAMNSGQETFPGISYTEISSQQDIITTPDDVSLHGGGGRIANLTVQDVCPGYVAEHLRVVTYDPVAYALAIDALVHDGPADPGRIDRSVCGQHSPPGVDPATLTLGLSRTSATIALRMATAGRVPEEPPLRCYVTAACGHQTAAFPTGGTRGPFRWIRSGTGARHHQPAVAAGKPDLVA